MHPEAENQLARQRQHALVIDDDPRVQRLMSRLLAMHGLQSAQVGDGREGLRLALATSYWVVLLDLNLPTLDGMSLLRRLMVTRPSQPVIVCSGQTDSATRSECLRAGAREFLQKPFTLTDFSKSLQGALPDASSGRDQRVDKRTPAAPNRPIAATLATTS